MEAKLVRLLGYRINVLDKYFFNTNSCDKLVIIRRFVIIKCTGNSQVEYRR